MAIESLSGGATAVSEPRAGDNSGRWVLIGMAVAVAAFVGIALVAIMGAGEISGDVVVGLIAALTTGVVSIVVSGLAHLDRVRSDAERKDLRAQQERERRSVRYEEVVLKSLEYFTGSSQRRNVGIAVVEGAWNEASHLRPVFVPLLVNQAVYLLEESGQGEARHEVENLERIMSLVLDSARQNDLPVATYEPLVRSIERRQARTQPGPGVSVEGSKLSRWHKALSTIGGTR